MHDSTKLVLTLAILTFMMGVMMIWMASQVRSQPLGWPHSEFDRPEPPPSIKERPSPRRNVVHRHRETRRVIRVPVPVIDTRCMPAVAIVGDQAVSEDGARSQSLKAWSQQVRFLHGELYMDPDRADERAFRCTKSSVENVGNRITEAVGVNSQFWRCQLIARPCAAPIEKDFGQ